MFPDASMRPARGTTVSPLIRDGLVPKTNQRVLWAIRAWKIFFWPELACPSRRQPHGKRPTTPVSTPKSDNNRWFAEEVQPHEPSLRSYLRAVFPSLPDIDDLVQESYARLIRARESGRVAYAKAFLFTTARNAAIDFFRRRKVVSIEVQSDISTLDVAEEGLDASEAVNKQQELELLSAAVRDLPDRCRQVLTLRLLYAMPQKDIARELGISEHTVKAQLAKGMRRCSEYFEHRGIDTIRGTQTDNLP